MAASAVLPGVALMLDGTLAAFREVAFGPDGLAKGRFLKLLRAVGLEMPQHGTRRR
jgi:hypothetical protein